MSGRVPMGKAFSVVAREADARIAAGHREHTAHRDGGILHPAAQLLISALQRTGKGFKLCRLPGPAAIQVIVLFLALVGVEGDAAAAVGGGLLQDIALRALMMYRAGAAQSLAAMLTALKPL